MLLAGVVCIFILSKPTSRDVLSTTTSSPALLALSPKSSITPPEVATTLVVSIGAGRTAFIHADLVFDNTKLKLSKDIDVSQSPLNRVIKLSSASDANTSGKITIALALDPSRALNPPSGTFNLATIYWEPNSTDSGLTASVDFMDSYVRVVNTNSELFTTSTANATFSINPSTAPTPSNFDSIPPTVVITTPTDGSEVRRNKTIPFSVEASDEIGGSGMDKVEFYINNSLVMQDTQAPYTYSWKVAGKRNAQTFLTAKAYDKAGNMSVAQLSVILK